MVLLTWILISNHNKHETNLTDKDIKQFEIPKLNEYFSYSNLKK